MHGRPQCQAAPGSGGVVFGAGHGDVHDQQALLAGAERPEHSGVSEGQDAAGAAEEVPPGVARPPQQRELLLAHAVGADEVDVPAQKGLQAQQPVPQRLPRDLLVRLPHEGLRDVVGVVGAPGRAEDDEARPGLPVEVGKLEGVLGRLEVARVDVHADAEADGRQRNARQPPEREEAVAGVGPRLVGGVQEVLVVGAEDLAVRPRHQHGVEAPEPGTPGQAATYHAAQPPRRALAPGGGGAVPVVEQRLDVPGAAPVVAGEGHLRQHEQPQVLQVRPPGFQQRVRPRDVLVHAAMLGGQLQAGHAQEPPGQHPGAAGPAAGARGP
mmetsp:Transcript_34708/g.110311  ORF Transcript_34708/g.110311 Transcript_34708/m.110311 type:complete len:325 (+) Transcript_34708:253-1227(+)